VSPRAKPAGVCARGARLGSLRAILASSVPAEAVEPMPTSRLAGGQLGERYQANTIDRLIARIV